MSGTNVEIYKNYGEVEGNKNNILVYVKDRKTYLLDANLDFVKDSIILDTIEGKEYQTVLGTDGTIYNLKTPINYPAGFVNSGIKYMSNNLNSDTNNVIVEYENGKIVIFNYKTGELIAEEQGSESNTDISNNKSESMLDYALSKFNSLKDSISNFFTSDVSTKESAINLLESYSDADEVKDFILKRYISEGKLNNYNPEAELKVMYNSETNKYEVYSINEVLSNKGEEVTSESEKVQNEIGVSDLSGYISQADTAKIGINSILLIAVIVISIYTCIYKLVKRNNK